MMQLDSSYSNSAGGSSLTKKQPANSVTVVTGAAGFLGSHLCPLLLSEGRRVVGIDNFSTGHRENVESLLANPNFTFLEYDVTDPGFPSLPFDTPIDSIYHLACPTGVPNITTMSLEMLLACSIGTRNVMELARRHLSKVLFTSSCEIYGQPQITPQHEGYYGYVNPVGVRSPYEEGKRFSESISIAYHRKYGIPIYIVRLFNVYGPGMSTSDYRVIPQFLNQIEQGDELVIYGDGSQTRTMTYIDDVTRALRIVVDQGQAGEVYNVGSEDTLTIRELADLVLNITKHPKGVKFAPHFIEDHPHRRANTEKLKKLGWEPRMSLEEGLRRTVTSRFPDIQLAV